jgi:hypothetical protein
LNIAFLLSAMRVTAAAALADTFTGRLSFDLPDEVASGFFEEEGSLVAITVFGVAIDQYNRAQLPIV